MKEKSFPLIRDLQLITKSASKAILLGVLIKDSETGWREQNVENLQKKMGIPISHEDLKKHLRSLVTMLFVFERPLNTPTKNYLREYRVNSLRIEQWFVNHGKDFNKVREKIDKCSIN